MASKAPAVTPKRPLRQLTVHEKLEAIQRVHDGESKASVARIIGVPESTLRGWCKNEEKLHAMANPPPPVTPSPPLTDDRLVGPSEAKRARLGEPEADTKKDTMDEALWFWLRNQQQHDRKAAPPELDHHNSSWFWRWYKHYGYTQPQVEEPQALVVRPKSTLDTVLLNVNNNNVQRDDAKENDKTKAVDGEGGGVSEDEDEPPETAAEAVKHGEKFLRWLECCSDPSVTAVQLLQFRYLLNNVRACAERRANKTKAAARSRRK